MFCVRAWIVLSGVGVCALMGGCASSSPAVRSTVALDNEPRQFAVYSDVTPAPAQIPVSKEDIINWSIRGVGDDVIIDRLQQSQSVFHLSTSEEIHLRDAGVSDEVVRTMKATAG